MGKIKSFLARSYSFALGFAVLLAFTASAQAELFTNQFIEFQLPEKWQCKLDGNEWVCQSNDEQKKRDAIIVLAAKVKKDGMDDLGVYKAHLEKKQVYQAPNNQRVISEPRYVKELNISSKTWIDSLHLQSEIPDFYTRYLATVEADLGILVTFSVRKDKYQEYSQDIETMVRTLKAFRKPGCINCEPGSGLEVAGGDVPDAERIVFPGEEACPKGQRRNVKTGECVATPKQDAGGDLEAILALLVILGAIGFIIYKKRKGRG